MRNYVRWLTYTLIAAFTQPFEGCIGGCSRCENQMLSDELKGYFFNFKQGSYWVYKNTRNGAIDSVYFVNQEIVRDVVRERKDCIAERGSFQWKGFAGNRTFGLVIAVGIPDVSISFGSQINFYSSLGKGVRESITVSGRNYSDVFSIENCCLSNIGGKCDSGYMCNQNDFEMTKLSFVRNVGIIRWTAQKYPVYGDVVYDLVRYKVVF